MADPKPKARRGARHAIAPPKPATPQFDRFLKAAREAEVTDDDLEAALAKVAPPRLGSNKAH